MEGRKGLWRGKVGVHSSSGPQDDEVGVGADSGVELVGPPAGRRGGSDALIRDAFGDCFSFSHFFTSSAVSRCGPERPVLCESVHEVRNCLPQRSECT